MSNNEEYVLPENPTIWERIKEFGLRRITIAAALPPYVLIAALYIIQQRTEATNRAEENAQQLEVDFNDCIGTARAREDNKENWYELYAFIREQPSPEAAAFADSLQTKFDLRFKDNIIQTPTDCLFLAEFKDKFTEDDIPPER